MRRLRFGLRCGLRFCLRSGRLGFRGGFSGGRLVDVLPVHLNLPDLGESPALPGVDHSGVLGDMDPDIARLHGIHRVGLIQCFLQHLL